MRSAQHRGWGTVSETQGSTTAGARPKKRRGLLFAILGVVVVGAAIAAAVVVLGDRTPRTSPPGEPAAQTATTAVADHSSQVVLVRAIHDLRSQYTYLNTYAFVTPPALEKLDPMLTFVTGTTNVDHTSFVSVATDQQTATIATRSPDGTCWYLLDAEPGSPVIAQDQLPGPAMYFNMQSTGSCNGATAPTTHWGQTFPQP